MHPTRVLPLLALLTVLITSLAVAAPVAAQEENPHPGAAANCRDLDAIGFLDELGLTRGECLNHGVAYVTSNPNRDTAGRCGYYFNEDQYGNKGQCVSSEHQLWGGS